VLARPCESVLEIITPGVTGVVESSFDGLVSAIQGICRLSRFACREEFEALFTVEAMMDRYEDVYRQMITGAL
jgi:glycosyltransferase involved in cell wall biosynthesis